MTNKTLFICAFCFFYYPFFALIGCMIFQNLYHYSFTVQILQTEGQHENLCGHHLQLLRRVLCWANGGRTGHRKRKY